MIRFPRRSDYVFRNRSVDFNGSDGPVRFPCICLYTQDGVPVAYPRFERYLFNLARDELKQPSTLNKQAYALCSFLNYVLHETTLSYIYEVSLTDVQSWFKSYRKTDAGEDRDPTEWRRGTETVVRFLAAYEASHPALAFSYRSADLVETQIVRNPQTRRKRVIENVNHLSVKPAHKTARKNRVLLHGYLEMLIFEARKYDPMLVLPVMLQAYAGLREGEIVNLTPRKIRRVYGGFGRISKVVLDLRMASPVAASYKGATFGAIKRPREQEVYPDFLTQVLRALDEHDDLLRVRGVSEAPDAPLFINKWCNPLTAAAYSARLQRLFYSHFLPHLKALTMSEGSWAQHAPYIEAYERDYPGAHMLRHWFTMYLITHTDLTTDEIAKWRGDASRESMLAYVHANSDMINVYRSSVWTFQEGLLEEIL